MNIVSYNVRGLGRGVKWAAIRRMIKKEGADMICIKGSLRSNAQTCYAKHTQITRWLTKQCARHYGGMWRSVGRCCQLTIQLGVFYAYGVK